MTQGTKIPLSEVRKIKPIQEARVVPELTKQIIEFCQDRTYAHFDEYHEKLIRDAKSMLQEVKESRIFVANVRRYLLYCEERDKPINSRLIMEHAPNE